MENCIFCQIVAGKSPSYKVYEDYKFYGLLDIFPVVRGHVLLIPKQHYQWVHDVPEFGTYWETALKVAKAVQKAMNVEWTQFFTHGLIPHAHIHILPRYDDIKLAAFLPKERIETPTKKEMNEIAEKIRRALK